MKLDAIGIVAKDLSVSVRFYQMLGLHFPELKGDEQHVEAVSSSGLRVMLDSEELMKTIKPWVQPSGQRMTLAFAFDNPAAVDEIYARFVEAGFRGEKEPWNAFWGQRYAIVLDPDGNAVDLFAGLLEF
jgi:Predicted lactoylglutathione lyase